MNTEGGLRSEMPCAAQILLLLHSGERQEALMDFALQWVGSSVNATLTHEEGELRSSANGVVEVVSNNLLSRHVAFLTSTEIAKRSRR